MIHRATRNLAGTVCASLILCAAGAPLRAHAQGWIVGGAVGAAKQQGYEIGAPVSSRDDTDTALRVFGGYMITPTQGVIASAVDFGAPTYSGAAFGGFTDELDANGIDVSYLIGWKPGDQQRIALFGTVGVVRWNQDVTYTDATGTFKYKDDGTSFSLGIGAAFNLSADGSNAWGFDVGYQLFKDVGETSNSGHEYDREMLYFGVDYRFGQ